MISVSKGRRDRVNPWTYVLLAALLIPFLFPLGWMFMSSLKSQVQNTAYPPVWVFMPTLANYREVFQKNPFFTFTVNSLVVALGSTGLALLLGLPGAYAIARFKRTGIALGILTARMAPGIGYLIPWFILFTKAKMIDTYSALILTHLIVALPLVLWVMIGFFEDVPGDLLESARIDGCTHWAAFLRIAIPLAKPGIVATGILAFIFSWNNSSSPSSWPASRRAPCPSPSTTSSPTRRSTGAGSPPLPPSSRSRSCCWRSWSRSTSSAG